MTIDETRMKHILHDMQSGTYDALSAGLDFFLREFAPALKEKTAVPIHVNTWREALTYGMYQSARLSNTLPVMFARALVLSFPPDAIVYDIVRFLKDTPSQRIILSLAINQTALKDNATIQELLSRTSGEKKPM